MKQLEKQVAKRKRKRVRFSDFLCLTHMEKRSPIWMNMWKNIHHVIIYLLKSYPRVGYHQQWQWWKRQDENNFGKTLNHRSKTQLLFPSPVCYGPNPMSCKVVSFSTCLFRKWPLLWTESWHTVIWMCTVNLTEDAIK